MRDVHVRREGCLSGVVSRYFYNRAAGVGFFGRLWTICMNMYMCIAKIAKMAKIDR